MFYKKIVSAKNIDTLLNLKKKKNRQSLAMISFLLSNYVASNYK